MRVTPTVRRMLSNYEAVPPGVKSNLCRILMTGRLAGSGRMIILPVDQGFEHGPARSFAANPPAYDPHYHYRMAIEAGLNAYAAPLGMLEAGADSFAGQIPTILKINSSNSLVPNSSPKDQAITSSVGDALRLGCAAIGFTIYPGSSTALEMFEEIAAMAEQAKQYGLAVVIWSYPRGESLSKEGESAMDGLRLCRPNRGAARRPRHQGETADFASGTGRGAKGCTRRKGIDISSPSERVRHVMQSAFEGRRIVVFSGGAKRGTESVFDDARAIRDGGGNGSIIGRNTFQRPKAEARAMLERLVRIYKNLE